MRTSRDRARRCDFVCEIQAPDGKKSLLLGEVKLQISPRDVGPVLDQAKRSGQGIPFVVTRFLTPRTRDVLRATGASYADATGNLRVATESPAVFIEREGGTTNPWAETRPIRSLKGPAAGRVVRALCDFTPPYGVRELAKRAEIPVASVSRVIAFLDEEAIVTREERGPILRVDWLTLIRRWTQDYSLTGSNRATPVLAARGLPQLFERLSNSKIRYAITASFAANRVAPAAPPKLATIYVEDARRAADTLGGLRSVETGSNVSLVEPFDAVVFERTVESEGLVYAALSQVAADLLTGPGRSPSEAEELLQWMQKNEKAWRARA